MRHPAISTPLRLLASVLVVVLSAGACSTSPSTDLAGSSPSPRLPVDATATPAPAPTGTVAPTSAPTPGPTTPEPTTPEPTAPEQVPTPTPAVPEDDSAAVIEHLDWVITENRIDDIITFVEDSHQRSFTGLVGVASSNDIGAELGSRFEPFPADVWALLQALNIVGEQDRNEVNQVRRDRIRGVCCSDVNGRLTVTVEPQDTRLETELIIVHELVHALHRQHPELFPRRPERFQSDEYPEPVGAVLEAIPQLVTAAWLDAADPADAAIARENWPVITPELERQTGAGAGLLLNFNYGVAPDAWADRYAEGGDELLLDLLAQPPRNWEQILFPDAWDNDEEPLNVRLAELEPGVERIDSGTIGVGLLYAALIEDLGHDEARRTIRGWIGDSWVRWSEAGDGRDCLSARVAMDTTEQAELFAVAIGESLDATTMLQPTSVDDVTVVRVDSC